VAKKSLPKAIRTTTVHAREASAGPSASERLAVAGTSSERLDSRPAAAKPVHASDIIDEPPGAPAQASPASPPALVRMAPMGAGIDAPRRRTQANSIVERHTAYAAVGGIIPVPIVNVASARQPEPDRHQAATKGASPDTRRSLRQIDQAPSGRAELHRARQPRKR
jgi:hypothetical protein